MGKQLIDRKEITIRFSEVDSMAIVWHGNYVQYLEEGRESFGKKYGISYLDIYANKVMAPVVNMDISFKRQVKYGETIIVETENGLIRSVKKQVYFTGDNIISSLGFSSSENFTRLLQGDSGIARWDNPACYPEPFAASMVDHDKVHTLLPGTEYTLLEKMLILSVQVKKGINVFWRNFCHLP